MKRISYLFSLLFLMTFVVFTSCKDDEGDGQNLAKENADKLAGTYTVTDVTRDPDAEVDLGDEAITITFTANAAGTGGDFSSSNIGTLPGDTDLPTSGTWTWPSTTSFNRIEVDPGNIILDLTSTPGADPLVFDYSASDQKGDFTATVTADKQ